MLSQTILLIERLQNADFLLLVMEPFFFYGLLFGMIFFLVGYFMGDARARLTGMIVIAASCFMLYPYLKLSEKVTPRITAMAGHWTNGSAVKEQNKRRHDTRWFFYALGAVAAAGAAAGGGGAKLINVTIIIFGAVMLFVALWLDMKEHEIYHPYIRHSTRVG